MKSSFRFASSVVAVFSLATALPAAAQVAGGAREEQARVGAAAMRQIEALVQEKGRRTAAQRKISSHLLVSVKAQRGAAFAQGAPPLLSAVSPDKQGTVLVDVRGTVGKPLVEAVEALGGTVVYGSPQEGRMRARLPLESLETLAASNDVRFIRPAVGAMTQGAADPVRRRRARPSVEERARVVRERLPELLKQLREKAAAGPIAQSVGSVDGEGDVAHNAREARNYFGLNGAEVKIGVLSDSVDFLAAVQAVGDLPLDVTVLPGQSGVPGSGEGTAMLEIVHDLAPGAKLFFATAFTSDASFADNIRALRAAGCDILVDDVIYFNESPFQDGLIAKAVEDVIADGALYFSSAGNGGNVNDGTSGAWEGDFRDGGTLALLPGGTVHDFGSGNISNRVERASPNAAALYWSDPLGTSGNDYDLFILNSSLTAVVDASTDVQDGDDDPFEIVVGPAANRRIVVFKVDGAETRAIHIQTFGGELAVTTPGDVHGHNSVTGAFAVAAVDAFLANGAPFTGGPTNPVELFSSDGPRRVFFKSDGTPTRPGVPPLFAGGGGERRAKPDIAAADGTTAATPGFTPFFGTSAAAPHAAALAALLKSSNPRLTPARIRNALVSTALDIEAPGKDRDSGAGIVVAFEALEAAGATPQAFIDLGDVTATPVGGDGDPFVEPGENGRLSVRLVNNGGATAIRLRGSLATSTPGVTLTSSTSAYPNIGSAGGSAVNTTPFAFSLANTVPCGTVVDFKLTATYTGRSSPRVFEFPLATGAAATVPVAIDYAGPAVAIPDNSPTGVAIPLAVSGFTGALADLDFLIGGDLCTAAVGATTVGLDHTWVGDLAIKLTSPAGTTVTLMSRPGGELNGGNNFCQTRLDDAATSSIQSIVAAGAPYTGSFKPASPLAAFVGEDPNGTWTLTVSDNARLDFGTARSLRLSIAQFECN
jgi:subtilisin-like proprotein convertase family protein